MTSALNPCETESQPSAAHCPARHICLILFGRMVVPLVLLIDPTNGSISIKLKRPLEARAAEEAIVCSNAGKFHVRWLWEPLFDQIRSGSRTSTVTRRASGICRFSNTRPVRYHPSAVTAGRRAVTLGCLAGTGTGTSEC